MRVMCKQYRYIHMNYYIPYALNIYYSIILVSLYNSTKNCMFFNNGWFTIVITKNKKKKILNTKTFNIIQ